jgi:HK97 family phage major capsid protein
MKNKTIYKIFNATVKDLGEGKLEAIVSTNDVDRHGEVVDIEGIDLSNYEKNPVVMWAHDYNLPPIGKTLEVKKEKMGKKMVLKTVMEFATEISDLAKEVYSLYKGGFLNAFSIGFMPKETDGDTYTKSELLEYSAVAIPANPNALLLAKAKGLDINILDLYTNSMNKQILEKELGDLTLKEVSEIKAHASELTAEQKEKFAEVLVEKDANSELLSQIDSKLSSLKDELKKELDPVEVKDIKGNVKDVNKATMSEEKHSKEELFKMYVVGLAQGDLSKYKSAMNTDDDSALLPPGEFVAEVERLEEELGVARKFANVRRSTKSTLSFLLGDDDLEVFDTDEAGAKTSTKNSYEKITLLWRKFAGILPITDELEEESAIDLWNDAVNRFARAFAKKEDQLVFTETSNVSPKNHGIMNVAGTNVVELSGDSMEDLSYDDIVDMVWGVPTPSSKNGRFWLNKDVLAIIQKIKDEEKRPIWQRAMADGTPSTILGKPYELVDVLPGIADDAADKKFMAFGDLKYVTLGERTGMNIQIFDSGIVGDPDEDPQGNDLNLITQDMKAMRAVKRMNAKVRFPAAFSVAKTSASAS